MSIYGRDDLYDSVQSVVDFRFDERVSAVFPDMIHRSVPGYATLVQLISVIAASYVSQGGVVYDLGCSLGGVSMALSKQLAVEATIEAVDLSEPMVERFRAWVEGNGLTHIHVHCADILNFPLQRCDVVVMNLTMQFLPPEVRLDVLRKIYAALTPSGVLIISEKTAPQSDDVRRWHEAFKRSQGYSELAIAQKRESLEHVMRTDRAESIEQRLHLAGFSHVEQFFQALPFCAWVARP